CESRSRSEQGSSAPGEGAGRRPGPPCRRPPGRRPVARALPSRAPPLGDASLLPLARGAERLAERPHADVVLPLRQRLPALRPRTVHTCPPPPARGPLPV